MALVVRWSGGNFRDVADGNQVVNGDPQPGPCDYLVGCALPLAVGRMEISVPFQEVTRGNRLTHALHEIEVVVQVV